MRVKKGVDRSEEDMRQRIYALVAAMPLPLLITLWTLASITPLGPCPPGDGC